MQFTLTQSGEVQLHVSGQNWQLTFDSPAEYGGRNIGPTPTEMTAICLAACKALTGLIWARRRGLQLDGLTVRVEADYASSPSRIGRVRVAVEGVGERLGDKRERFIAAMEACPVANTLRHPPAVELTVT